MNITIQYDKSKYGHTEGAIWAVLNVARSNNAQQLDLSVSYPHPAWGIATQGDSKVRGFDLSMSSLEARRFAAAIFRVLDGDEEHVVVKLTDGV